jgi:hypothetical protein
MRWTNEYRLPGPIADWLKLDEYDHDPDPNHFSATELVQPVRLTILKRRHADEMVKDVSQAFTLSIGTACHHEIERVGKMNNQPYGQQEPRFERTVGKNRISGQIDWYDGHTVTDWKVTSVWSVKNTDKSEWTHQLNIYAWLLRYSGKPVESLQIGAICRDWRVGELLRYGSDYPPIMFMMKQIELWSQARTDGFISTRLGAIRSCEKTPDEKLPICSADERWLRDEKWAVMKEGRKSAVKLHDTRYGAEEHIKSLKERGEKRRLTPEHRPGTSVRCRDYCDAAPFCSYWKEHVNED